MDLIVFGKWNGLYFKRSKESEHENFVCYEVRNGKEFLDATVKKY